ncbi:MAG: DUF4019 domain-containing protein [Sphingomonas sp.]
MAAIAADARPLPAAKGDAVPAVAVQRAVTDASYAYFAAKDGGRYDAAYKHFAASVRAYLTPALYRSEAANFNIAAGGAGERRIVSLTWERDPPDAPAPGLYVAADFVSRFPGLRLHCGYLMWRQEPDGAFRIVREEQSFLDEQAARAMTPERLATLPQKFGCPAARP